VLCLHASIASCRELVEVKQLPLMVHYYCSKCGLGLDFLSADPGQIMTYRLEAKQD
jgi:hypothetical protein